jgi:hypothetical protein
VAAGDDALADDVGVAYAVCERRVTLICSALADAFFA